VKSEVEFELNPAKVQYGCFELDLDLESNRQTSGSDITPMEMKGGTTEDDA